MLQPVNQRHVTGGLVNNLCAKTNPLYLPSLLKEASVIYRYCCSYKVMLVENSFTASFRGLEDDHKKGNDDNTTNIAMVYRRKCN